MVKTTILWYSLFILSTGWADYEIMRSFVKNL